MKISQLGEQALIKQIADLWGHSPAPDSLGIGDDAALVKPQEGMWQVITKDMLVEGIHFLLPAMAPADLGYKSLAVNISDIAAMGGLPRHAYVGLALPKETDVAFVLEFYRGMKMAADPFGMRVSGGDTVGSPGPVVISITAQGEVMRENAMLRSGASPGDLLFVTGPLGASAAGLLLLLHQVNCPAEIRQQAMEAHLRPRPRVAEGNFLAQSGAVTAAMDLSDGLVKDLGEICEASGCGATVYQEQLPVHPAAATIAALRNLPSETLALNGGEDYELLLAVRPDAAAVLESDYRQRFGVNLLPIGEITKEPGTYMITKEGKREKLSFTGFQHF